MSVGKINSKLAKAFAKVGNKIGYVFSLYRADSLIDPLSDRNRILSVPLTWSKDDAFSTNPEPVLDYFKLFCDFTVLRVGDILHHASEGRTFLVYEITPLRGAVGVQCNKRMNVFRPVHTPLANKKTALSQVVSNMPCAVQSIGASSSDGALSSVRSSMSTGQTKLEVWTVFPADTVKLSDIIEISGARYIVTSLDNVSAGVKITAFSTKAGT